MSIRKRTLPSGEVRWMLDYRDQQGARRGKLFATKGAAIAAETRIRGELVRGIHTADSASATIAEAADVWLAACEARGLEPSTIAQYKTHVRGFIVPLLGSMKLSRLTAPVAQDFVERVTATASRAMVRKVATSLKSLVGEAVRRGLAATNAVREVRLPGSSRDEEPAEFPSRDEIKMLLDKAEGQMKVLVHLGIFTGMRASEIRGLEWENVDLKESIIRVRQRADRLNKIGRCKSNTSQRDIPIGQHLVALLREWRLVCPRTVGADDPGVLRYVLPNKRGNVEDHPTVYRRFGALQLACGITAPVLSEDGRPTRDKDGRPVVRQKFGLHAMRHACASLLIAEDWQPKRVQAFLGHATIGLTMDTYSHLWHDAEADQQAMARLEGTLLR
ncbi:MAG TPA: tyrosine-type recombinase/integrase [Stellaceae bacterium]|nr:tyrosine-type recombinase/integrase [Stellaceae bacterium]